MAQTGSLLRLALPQPNARAVAVILDEYDAGGFEGALERRQCRILRLRFTAFKIANGRIAYHRGVSELLLRPIDKRPGSAALCWRDHRWIDNTSGRNSLVLAKIA